MTSMNEKRKVISAIFRGNRKHEYGNLSTESSARKRKLFYDDNINIKKATTTLQTHVREKSMLLFNIVRFR